MKYYVIICVVAVLITDILTRLAGIQQRWIKQIIPMIVCLVFFGVPWMFEMGVFHGSVVWLVLISVSGGVCANGLYTYGFIRKSLDWLLNWMPKHKS